MRVLARLLTVVAVLITGAGAVAIGDAVGMPISQAAPLGLLLGGLTIVSLTRVLGEGAGDSPFVVAGYVMLLLAALGAIPAGKEIWPRANAFGLFVGALAVEGTGLLLLGGLLTTVTKRVVRSRRTRQRRRLAASHGWRFKPSDPDLPSALGGAEHYVVDIPGLLLAAGSRPVPEDARAYDVVSGEAGVEFVAFDFFVPRRRPGPEVSTAWLVRLPHSLPLFTSAEVFRDTSDGQRDSLGAAIFGLGPGDEAVTATNPGFARAVMTEDVIAFTRERLASWWVDGPVLVSTARVRHGAPTNLLVKNIEGITWLATVLSSPRLGRYSRSAVEPEHARPPAV